jgi:thioredoxin:protein disulfide reductase
LLVGFGVLVGGIHLSFHDGLGRVLRKGVGIVAVVAGLFGVIASSMTPKTHGNAPLNWIYSEKAGVAAAKAAHKPALIDFFADWCIPCKEMDVKTFARPEIAAELQRFQLVKMDCSKDEDPVVKATQERYRAVTLPTVVLLDSAGRVAHTIDHFVTADELLPLLETVH